MISQRPAEAEDRAIPGHWEGDLILGLDSSAIGTLVERTTRSTVLLHLPRMKGHGDTPRAKNGPALAGHGAQAVRDAIAASIGGPPEHLRRSLTWDQGAEMSQHMQLRIDSGIPIYFCDPHSPWQRATNENTNGLLRQYFPKGADLSRYGEKELAAVTVTLDSRPRKTLGWRAPAEAFDELQHSGQTAGVATTPWTRGLPSPLPIYTVPCGIRPLVGAIRIQSVQAAVSTSDVDGAEGDSGGRPHRPGGELPLDLRSRRFGNRRTADVFCVSATHRPRLCHGCGRAGRHSDAECERQADKEG